MGFFKDERFEGLENELVVVKGDVAFLEERNGVLEIENAKLVQNYGLLEQKYVDNTIEIDDLKGEVNTLKQHLEKLLSVLDKEEKEEQNEKVIKLEVDNMISDGWYSYKNICKAANVGVQATAFKYYLSDYGVLTKIVNHEKNSFKVNMNELMTKDFYINGHCKVHKGQLLFDETMIQYIISNANKIKESYNVALRKTKEYIDTKAKLESINFKNYREEIRRICNGDTSRYFNGYKVLQNKYPNFFKEYEECNEKNKHLPQYSKHGVTKLEYICKFMKEGNYFLKIICELYA